MSYPQTPPPPPAQYPAQYPAPYPAPPRPSNGLAIAGFVLGLLGFLGSFIPLLNIGAMLLALVGVILAAVGLAKARGTGTGKGLGIAGVVLGVLALVIAVLINVVFANAVDDAVDEATDTVVDAPAEPEGDAQGGEVAQDDETQGDEAGQEDGSALGTTRDNPAPIGSTITAGDWTVTINSVTTAAADSIGQTPQAGSTLLVINMTATYTGTDPQGETSWASVDFVTADGTTIGPFDGSTLFLPEEQFDTLTTLYEGGSVTGDEMIEVPADSWQNGVLVVSPDVFSDSTFVAVQ